MFCGLFFLRNKFILSYCYYKKNKTEAKKIVDVTSKILKLLEKENLTLEQKEAVIEMTTESLYSEVKSSEDDPTE